MDTHPLAGKKIRLKDGAIFVIEDWWLNIGGSSWMKNSASAVCINYALRAGRFKLPVDDRVVYGYIKEDGGIIGHLMHQTEIEGLEVIA